MPHTRITVLDKKGSAKDYSIEKAIFFVGSEPGNDIVLPDSATQGVFPRHLQVIAFGESGYRVVNLGNSNLTMSDGQLLTPRSSVNIVAGQGVKLGTFSLSMQAEVVEGLGLGYAVANFPTEGEPVSDSSNRNARSHFIGMTISLTNTLLTLDTPIEGTVTITNLGDRPGVQFLLELEGLEPGTYELGPGPILFPNAEKSTFLRISHPQKPFPLAGDHRFTIRAAAPEDYPGDSVTVVQAIHVLPFYKHKLRLLLS
jgi:hypothetical protein